MEEYGRDGICKINRNLEFLYIISGWELFRKIVSVVRSRDIVLFSGWFCKFRGL